MLPPGRRRIAPLQTLLPLILLLVLSTTASAASAVLGIDLGTEYIKAALVKPGVPLDIVLTKDSRRKEAATIAFKPARSSPSEADSYPERLYGADASALSARFPGDVYPNLKPLLGLSLNDDSVKSYLSRFPGLAPEEVRGKIGFKSQTLGKEQEPVTVEELLAMELQNIQANAQVAVGKGLSVTEAVITVPAFYTAAEKQAVEFAADLAGLRVLALMSDGLAVGLNYATSRTFASISDGAKPEYHIVYDIGAGSATATVLKFQGRTVKEGKRNSTIQEVQVVGTGWDKTLGGDALNQLLVDDMLTKFLDRPRMKEMQVEPIHVRKHAKTMARFWKDAERLRQVLSANSQTQTSFEGIFYEDMNFKYQITRAEFEELAADYAKGVSLPITKALEAGQLKLSDIESVILHGGAVRTPFAQKELELAVGKAKIKTNVNADEAAALGAGFKAATISPSFRVKEIRAYDTPGFAISFKYDVEGKPRQQKLFTQTSHIGVEKHVPIKAGEDTAIEFYQSVDGKDIPILEVKTTNLTQGVAKLTVQHGCIKANLTTFFSVRLSPVDGLPEVVGGTVSCEVEEAEKPGVMDKAKGLFGFGSKKDGQEPLKEESSSEDTVTESSSSKSDTTATSSSASSSASASTKAAPTSNVITYPIRFSSQAIGTSARPDSKTVAKMQTRLTSFDASDRARRLKSEAFNTLEAYTYRSRDYLSDDSFISFSSDAIRDTLESKLSEVNDWLYGDGLDASLNELKAKLKDLKTLIDPVLRRKDESGKRDGAVENLKKELDSMKNMIKMVTESIEKQAADAAVSASAASLSASLTRTPEEASPFTTVGPSESAATPGADDDLEADPYSTTTSTTSVPENTAIPEPIISPYTSDDLSTLQSKYDSIESWLEKKLAAQSKLGPTDDPAILTSDLQTKAKELMEEISSLIRKKVKIPPRQSSSKPTKSKTKKKKSKTSSSSSATETAESVTAKATNQSAATATTTPSAKRGKDEL